MFLFPDTAPKAKQSFLNQVKIMIMVIPPIFLLLGLFDVWVPREFMIQHMGEKSGIRGPLLAFLWGSAAAGPLYGAFPIAAILYKKGASVFNILIFIGAWSTTKIPMFLFEMNALGYRFAFSRLIVSIVGIILIAIIVNKSIPDKDKNSFIKNDENAK